jgi:threo-3-hydroxy-L-aspartate ammonia-lyase
MTSFPVRPEDVTAARDLLRGIVSRTPLLHSRVLSERLGGPVYLKCENLQRTGSFKARGGYVRMARLTETDRARGVVVASAGNHAQGVAFAAASLGVKATVFMPEGAPLPKIEATKGYGADVILYGASVEDAMAAAIAQAQERGSVYIHPFDHPDVIAGQGTAAKELFEDVGPLDALFAPLGGGGLLSGSALSARALAPACKIYGVEPEAGNDGQQSFRAGEIVHIKPPKTIADGAQTQHLGKFTFPIIRREVDDILTASDAELVEAMRFFASRMKLIVEPTGCLGYAAAQAMKHTLKGKRVGVLISGGNVDIGRFCSLLA